MTGEEDESSGSGLELSNLSLDEKEEEDPSMILYDILVFKEWTTSETTTTTTTKLADAGERVGWGQALRSYLFRSNPGSGCRDVARFLSLTKGFLGWRMSVTKDSLRLALANQERIEILAQSQQQNYVTVAVIKVINQLFLCSNSSQLKLLMNPFP